MSNSIKVDLVEYRKNSDRLDRIVIRSQNGFKILTLDKIISIQSMSGNYVFFNTSTGDQLICSRPMSYFEDHLPHKMFCRVHRSHIINLDHLHSFNNKKAEVSMSDGSKIPVAIRRMAEFRKLINSTFI